MESGKLPEYSTYAAAVSDLSCTHTRNLDISDYPRDLKPQSSSLHGVAYSIMTLHFVAGDIK